MLKGGARVRGLIGFAVGVIALLAVGASPAIAGSAKLVKYRAADDDPTKDNVKFFDHGGMELFGDCSPVSAGESDMSIIAKSTSADSSLRVIIKAPTDDVSTTVVDDFDSGEAVGIGSSQFDHDASGLLVYARPGGVNVSIKFAAVEDLGFESTKDCAFFGVARVLDSTSSSRVNFRSAANGSGGFDATGVHFNASCNSSQLGVQGIGELDTGSIGYEHRIATGTDGFFVVPSYGDGAVSAPVPSDDGLGQIVYAAPSGGPNLTIDWLSGDASDAQGDGTPFGGTKQCAWAGTARTRSAGDPLRVNFRGVTGMAMTPFFANGGLTLRGACAAPDSVMIIEARSTVDNAVIAINRALPSSYEHNSDPNFDTQDYYYPLGSLGIGTNDATGQIVYSKPDGTVTTIDWMAIQGPTGDKPFGGAKDCAFVGTAEKKLP